MNLTFRACESQIERQSYISKEDMRQKLDIFLVGDRITQTQYEELTEQLSI
ncbi:hypothetical protein SAMN05421670_0811 [Psychrobacillus psychrotolerans]|uniref:Uncharacterized protein n=1 Tax=Psychrobacillus psychrotolerans TaxID=126156 RepID=A0A1I5VH63_9BACI|nr:hypothetical protein [Psychrobacillus psychrotolerans]SFQ06732.1 hypothetical protein SAMN05421670_0811 [Psychrobacillus psychrotolerans]